MNEENTTSKKVPVAILGSGKIGTDLMYKINKSDNLFVKYFVGRNEESLGLKIANELGIATSSKGFNYLVENNDDYQIIFDATSAEGHFIHAPILEEMNKKVIDMTPAKIGSLCIPSINSNSVSTEQNVNMITCGGQASIPLAYAISQSISSIDYIEIITSISSASAGLATRRNIDEYILTTELAVKQFTGCGNTKVILNLNPAEPCVDMQTTVYCSTSNPNMPLVKKNIERISSSIQKYVPGYEIVMDPIYQEPNITVGVRVKGTGDFLPSYAGNLDIINCAAVNIAEHMVKNEYPNTIGAL